MSDVHVLRRALRWDLTTPTFSSRAAIAEMKIRLDENTRVPEVVAHWRSLTTGKLKLMVFVTKFNEWIIKTF